MNVFENKRTVLMDCLADIKIDTLSSVPEKVQKMGPLFLFCHLELTETELREYFNFALTEEEIEANIEIVKKYVSLWAGCAMIVVSEPYKDSWVDEKCFEYMRGTLDEELQAEVKRMHDEAQAMQIKYAIED